MPIGLKTTLELPPISAIGATFPLAPAPKTFSVPGTPVACKFVTQKLLEASSATPCGPEICVDEPVITRSGAPNRNLYAAGELLGMAALQGRSYCGGMSVMPALSFGRLLGSSILPLGAQAAHGA